MKSCPLCGNPLTRVEHGDLDADFGNKTYILKDMSYLDCPYCDEQFFNPQEAKMFDEKLKLAKEKKENKEEISIVSAVLLEKVPRADLTPFKLLKSYVQSPKP